MSAFYSISNIVNLISSFCMEKDKKQTNVSEVGIDKLNIIRNYMQ